VVLVIVHYLSHAKNHDWLIDWLNVLVVITHDLDSDMTLTRLWRHNLTLNLNWVTCLTHLSHAESTTSSWLLPPVWPWFSQSATEVFWHSGALQIGLLLLLLKVKVKLYCKTILVFIIGPRNHESWPWSSTWCTPVSQLTQLSYAESTTYDFDLDPVKSQITL